MPRKTEPPAAPIPPPPRKENRTKRKPLSEATKKRRAAKKALRSPKFTQKRAVGRPPIYEAAAHCSRARKLALLGLTDEEVADQFGISHETMAKWKRQHPEFVESLTSGKTPADAEMAASLYKRGIGFEVEAVKIFAPQTPGAAPIYAPYMEYHPPDVGAQKVWLFNRQPHRWRDRQQVDVGGTIEHRLLAMTPEERTAEAIAFANKMRQAIADARKTIDGEATEVEE